MKKHKDSRFDFDQGVMDGPGVASALVTGENVSMARLRRRWRTLKWAGLVLSLLIVVAWAVSLPWMWYYQRHNIAVLDDEGDCRGYSVYLGDGCLLVVHTWAHPEQINDGPHVQRQSLNPIWSPSVYARNNCWEFWLPLWMPFLIIAIPTAVLWRRDRRIPPGHCQNCGYNLTGNISGVCPECGEKI
jgi:hypothetical protein